MGRRRRAPVRTGAPEGAAALTKIIVKHRTRDYPVFTGSRHGGCRNVSVEALDCDLDQDFVDDSFAVPEPVRFHSDAL